MASAEAAAEEKPRQEHEADGLPERDLMQSEESGHEPVPKVQDRFAKGDEDDGRED
jgi:hypothetical protein